jgi:hypothetical protein
MTTESNTDRLAKARAARLNPPDTESLKVQSATWEAARIADLYIDEAANPDNYCVKVAPWPTDGVCTHCQAANALIHKQDRFGQYLYCVQCGSDYFPDSEPVPAISYKGGRHTNGDKVGEHHNDYDDKYREQRRKNAKA